LATQTERLPLSDGKQFQYESEGRILVRMSFEQTNQSKDKKQLNGVQLGDTMAQSVQYGTAWARSI